MRDAMNGWTSPVNGGHPASYGHGLDAVSMIIGELRTGQAIIVEEIHGVKAELKAGTEIHRDLTTRIVALETRKPVPPPIEVWLKHLATIGLPLATLWATGSIEKALAVLDKVRGVAGH